ncbi:MAG: hypothetical protein Q9213_000097 [Squamulea squamosa]
MDTSVSHLDALPVQFSKTSSKGNTKEDTDAADLSSTGKSKGALSGAASGLKLQFKNLRKPSPEAEKLQRSLHEKFLAQRRRDAIALQLGPSEQTSLPAKRLGKKEKKIVAKKKQREARRAMKKVLVENSTVEQITGPEEPQNHSLLGPTTSVLPFDPPDTEKVVGKRNPKIRKKRSLVASLHGGSSSELSGSEPIQHTVSEPEQSLQAEPEFKAYSTAKEDAPLQELSSQKSSTAKRKSVRMAKVKKSPKSPKSTRTKPKVVKRDNLNVRRLPSKGRLMEPCKLRKRSSASENSKTSNLVHRVASHRAVTEDKTVKSKGRTRSTGAKQTVTTTIETVDANELVISALDLEQPPVPHLSYGLERVLFNPGVYHLQDPRSRVYNFDPYLQTIMPVADFNFDALREYITSSRDTALQELAASYNKRYVGSSSSMTGILAHFHFLLSQWRSINTQMLSREFPDQQSSKFTELQRSPSAIFLKWRNGSYAIDADKEFAGANVLMFLGKSMEKLLTLETEDFEKYRKSSPGEVPVEEQNAPESYHYSTMCDFIMRSQLDAHDPRLPGTGMFDLKTRAVVSVRMDASHPKEGAGYQIKSRQGAWESFEREYFDMIRSAFLKYSLQVRMGRMDGIFVAFHNTDRIFGFQYISLSEMDSTLHGQWDTCLGDQEFKLSIALLNDILNRATKKYPETSLRLHFETREAQTPFMYIFAEPVTEDQITAIQTANDAKIQEFEQEIFGKKGDVTDGEEEDQGWENLQANVQDAMDEDLRDPSHDDGRTNLDPVLISNKRNSAQEPGLSDSTGSVSPSDRSIAAAAEDDEDLDDDSGEDEEADLDDEAEEDEDEEDEEGDDDEEEDNDDLKDHEEGNDEDSDEVVPGGILVDHGLGQDAKPDEYADGVIKVQDEAKDAAVSLGQAEKQGVGAAGGTANRGETSGNIEVQSLAESDHASSSERAEPSAIADLTSDASTDRVERDGADGNQDVQHGDEFPTGADVPFIERISQTSDVDARPEGKELLALTLTIRNKVNESYVLRPENLSAEDKWTTEYSLDEVSNPDRAWSLYQACQIRRKKKLDDVNRRSENDDEVDAYIRKLREMSRKGAEWRKKQDEKDKASPIKVLGQTNRQGKDDGI